MSLAVRVLYLLMLVNISCSHYFWFDMPSSQRSIDGSEIPYYDEPLQMQKRFHVKYVRELGRLPGDYNQQPMRREWSTPMSPQDQIVDLYKVFRHVV